MPSLQQMVEALDAGRAFVDLSTWRKVRVRGDQATEWLNDLLSADLTGLEPGEPRRSLLLSPTGRIRADVMVSLEDGGFILLQDPVQDTAIDEALSPYILSSDVTLEDASEELGLLAFPERSPPRDVPGHRSVPSVLGRGADVLIPASDVPGSRAAVLRSGVTEAPPEAAEAWRIRRGRPRVGVDLREDSLPHEAVVGDLIGYSKGCFLGQEAVAKVRNLGHPPFVLLAVTARTALSANDPVTADHAAVGLVTSADATLGPGSTAIVRVRWKAGDADLRAADDTPLERRGPADLSA